MRVFGIAGFKNAGKTTLVVELLQELGRRGLRVATVKHAHHAFDIDHPGKDSFEHRAAGACEVIVASARRFAHIRELDGQREPELGDLLAQLGTVDLVLVEGYKHGSHPKLELRRDGVPARRLAPADSSVKAIVADFDLQETGLAVLRRDDVAAIADFVLAHAAPL
ncbi:MAG: molybdopterin-guanine dinucleotide biosynthesis protein B [Gammaproteobacteria bacterium]|nr:molybdopterin-guanine dinucleotide biosynthesis protein B [Gammaproteobacteria bacterium]